MLHQSIKNQAITSAAATGGTRAGRASASRGLGRAALIIGLAAALTAANFSVAMAGDDDDDETLMSKFMTGIGLKKAVDYNPINYGERSPLVVPPSRDLPTPVEASAPPTPQWPKDPDVKRRKESKSKTKKVVDWNLTEDSRPLMPHELEQGRVRGQDEGKPGVDSASAQNQSSQAELGNRKGFFNFNWFKKEEYGTFTGEPSRAELTDPPVGYRTPSADQPYGIGRDKTVTKGKGIGERMETETGR